MNPFAATSAVALLLGATACQFAPGEHYRVRIDPNLTPLEQEETVTSFERWHEAAGVEFDITVGSCEAGTYVICVSTAADLGVSPAGVKYYAMTDRTWWNENSTTQILTNQPPTRFSYLVRHEIGHALGLEHTQAGTLMMSFDGWKEDPKDVITCADVQQYSALRGQRIECDEPYQLSGK